jgi:hypothetical protein
MRPHSEISANLLNGLRPNFLDFSERALIVNANQLDFDSAIRRFESSRPSQPQRRGIEYGLAEHDVAAIIEVIREISSQEKGKSKTRRSA